LQYNLNDISARYEKDVIVVETAYAFTDQEDDFHPNIASSEMAIPGYPLDASRAARYVKGCNGDCSGCA
jgi:arabinogalactan endo-1,4-beta-galactosidase